MNCGSPRNPIWQHSVLSHTSQNWQEILQIISGSFDCAYLSSSVRVPWLSFGAVVVIVAVSKVELFEVSSLSKNSRTVDCGSPDQPSSKFLAYSPHVYHRLVFNWQIRRRSIISKLAG